MKKLLAAMVFGMVMIVGSISTTEAEYVNNYETIIAEDGCCIYTAEAFARYANEHRGQVIKDTIFIQTKQHIIHSAIRG